MSPSIPIPQLALWEQKMQSYGDALTQALANPAANGPDTLDWRAGNLTYYDGQAVMFQIYDYAVSKGWSNTAKWLTAAENAERIQRDQWLIPSGYNPSGPYLLTEGVTQSWLRTGDAVSRTTAIEVSKRCAFCLDTANDLDQTGGIGLARYARETAYVIHALMNAEKCGEARRTRLAKAVGYALNHIDVWWVAKSDDYLKPFFMGLLMSALARYDREVGDSRIVPKLKVCIDGLMASPLWKPTDKTFWYMNKAFANEDPPYNTLSHDLNLLICPAYAWVYHKTGELKYRQWGDEIFEGGVVNAWLGSSATVSAVKGKQFNQNYRYSFEYVKYASLAPDVPVVVPPQPPVTPPTQPPQPPPPPPPQPPGTGLDNVVRMFRARPVTMYMPVAHHTWEAHFLNRGWRTPQDQINAGYPLYVQPTPMTAKAVLEVDLQGLLTEAVQIDATISQDTVAGSVAITPTLSVSTDGTSYTDFPGVWNAKATNVRYIRLTLDAVGANAKSITTIPEAKIRVTVKEKTEAGTVTCSASDTNGTKVTLRKQFADLISVVVTPRNQGGVEVGSAYDFEDVPNPTYFYVYLFRRSDGARVSGTASWTVRGI